MSIKSRKFSKGIVTKPTTDAATREGEQRTDSADNKQKIYLDGAEREVLTADQVQTVESKTIDGTAATGNNTVTTDADQVTYDNTTSGLTATNLQDAVDELEAAVEASDEASEISYDNTSSGLTATNVQDAVDEVEGRVDTLEPTVASNAAHVAASDGVHGVTGDVVGTSGSQLISNKTFLDNSLNKNELYFSFDHVAGSDSSTGEATVTATRSLVYVQGVGLTGIEGLDADQTRNERTILQNQTGSDVLIRNEAAGAAAEDRIVTGTGGDINFPDESMAMFQYNKSDNRWTLLFVSGSKSADSLVYNNASSGLTATDVQAAIDEVEARVDTLETDLAAHEAATSGVHGVTGDVVGTSYAQVITNKDIDGGTASNTNRITVPKDTLSNLEALTRKEGTVLYATDEKKAYIDNGTDLIPVGSGSGGAGQALNLLEDPSFELEEASPTLSSGFAVASFLEYTVDEGLYTPTNTKHLRVNMGGADTLSITDSKNHDADLEGMQGLLSIWLKTSSSGFKVGVVIDGVDPSVDNVDQLDVADTGIWKKYELPFVFGSTSVSYKVYNDTSDVHAIDIDNIYMGLAPDGYVQNVGDNITDWQDFPSTDAGVLVTATGTNPSYGTVVNNIARYRRVGSNMEIEFDYSQGTPGSVGTGIYLLNLPEGYQIDTSKKPVNTNTSETDNILDQNSVIGTGYFNYVAGGSGDDSHAIGSAIPYSDTQVKFLLQLTQDDGSSDTRYWGSAGYAFGFGTGMAASVRISVPIQGWSTGRTDVVTQRDELPVVRAAGNGGESITTNVTNIPFAEVEDNTNSWDGSTFTAPESGNYLVSGQVIATAASVAGIFSYINGSEDKAIGFEGESAQLTQFNSVVTLQKNDVLSIRSDSTFTLSNEYNKHTLNIQKLPTNPQIVGKFAQIKSSETPVVRGSGTGTTSYTANTPVPFTEVEDTAGAWDGSAFTAPADGYYSFVGGTSRNSGTYTTTLYVDGSYAARCGQNDNGASGACLFAINRYLAAGQTASIRISANSTLNNSPDHQIHIQRIPDTESIVKNLAAQDATVAARYTSDSGASIPNNSSTTVIFEDLEDDTHSAYNTSTGVYTVPVSGWYTINSRLCLTGRATNTGRVFTQALFTGTHSDGVAFDIEEGDSVGYDLWACNGTIIRKLNAGDTFQIQINQDTGASRSLLTSGVNNYLQIIRHK